MASRAIDEPRRRYEAAFARLVGARHAVSFGYARHALSAILGADGLRADDEVVLSPLTCRVVPLALLARQLRPVYADIDPATLNLAPDGVTAAIGPKTGAILFQHTYGHPGGHDGVAEIADRRGLLLVEDRAQTLPCSGAAAGLGVSRSAAIYSNNLQKPLPAASGGVAVTNDEALARRIAREAGRLGAGGWPASARLRLEIALHRWILRPRLYWPLFDLQRRFSPTYRDRPLEEEIASEIRSTARAPAPFQLRRGLAWIARAEALAGHVRECCAEYADALRGVEGLGLPLSKPDRPLYYFPVLVPTKMRLLERARRARVELVAWPIRTPIYPVASEAQLASYGYEKGSCPRAEALARRLVGLPTHRAIGPLERARIVELLRAEVGA